MPWKTTINHDLNADYYQFTTFSSSDMMIKPEKVVPGRGFSSCLELLSVCLLFRPNCVFTIYEHFYSVQFYGTIDMEAVIRYRENNRISWILEIAKP